MTASAKQRIPFPSHDGFIGFRTTAEQELVIRKAAELSGWTVAEYVRSAVLDRAERDLYEHAAQSEWEYGTAAMTAAATEPFDSLVGVYGEL
ncbi:MAG: DUF1778 domain-containing protein [Actinomadura sp.]|jgi:uncharacterized protein (DUF1778 family)